MTDDKTVQQRDGGVAARAVVNLLIVGLPFLAACMFILINSDLSSQTSRQASLAIIFVGALFVLVGFYASLLPRPRLESMWDEEILKERQPSMKPPLVRIGLSVPFFVASGYLLEFTGQAYIYPLAAFLIAMYLYFRGVVTYWVNLHTAYYVTNRRVVHMYKFFSRNTTEISVNPQTGISETQSFIERLTGRGSVLVTNSVDDQQKVHIKEIDNPNPVAVTLSRLKEATLRQLRP